LSPHLEGRGEWQNLCRRTREIGARIVDLKDIIPEALRIAADFERMADSFNRRATALPNPVSSSKGDPMSDPGNIPLATKGSAEPSSANNKVEVATGRDVTIEFEVKRCIHARFCVIGAPSVFKANTPGEWIFPDTMDAEKLVAIAEACPSGAIRYQRNDGRPNETPPPVNALRIRENGPYAVHANIDLAGQGTIIRATLCRCGASKNTPYCDGSHNDAHFLASGEPSTRESEPLALRDGVLTISPQRNGPLAISGSLEICSGTGRTINRLTSARLCRCGGSSTKPFCDGTHTRIGFKSEQE
jgi:CDGSH-type Zn-finger protein/uncharacterized Fe-S cluster protein YjdI